MNNVPPKKYDIKWTLMERLSSKTRTKMALFIFENFYRVSHSKVDKVN